MSRLALGLGVVFACGLACDARAEETEVSFAYVPAPQVEQVIVDQPLGRLTVRGWDRQEVRIAATKRAPDHRGLERLRVRVDLKDGRVEIVTGVRVGDVLRTIPTDAGYVIDLAVDAPTGAQIRASTFDGDLDAIGLRAGAELRSDGGAIHATDIDGPVRCRATKGRQRLAAIRGDVDAEGLRGDLELDSIEGALLRATLVDGVITARRIRARAVELATARGDIELIGAMPIGARWALRAPRGKGRVHIEREPTALILHADGGITGPGVPAGAHDFKLARPGAARLVDVQVSGELVLLQP